jgi:uncharacterized protein
MSVLSENPAARPWYREPWPWMLMAGPFTVIVAGMITLWLAIESSDGLVADDYYKRGLAINQTLSRERLALERHYRAQVTFSADARRVRVMLSGDGELPAAMQLQLAHPTRAGMDERVMLHASAPGWFEAQLAAPVRGRRLIVLEDAARTWRLSAEAGSLAGNAVELSSAER